MRVLLFTMLNLCMVQSVVAADRSATVEYLRCEYQVDPLAIDTVRPRLSWEMHDSRRGARQTAYQVLVASSPQKLAAAEGDLWDSGKVASDATIQVVYAGRPLTSRMRCCWTVRVWDAEGQASPWSSTAIWEMGLLRTDDWKARWIHDGRSVGKTDADFYRDDPAPLFRKEFVADKPVRQARLYVTGLGYGYPRLNGRAVGDRLLDPAWTDYGKRVLYSTYDVTRQIVRGPNCLGLTLGNGWYNPLPLLMWDFLNLREHLLVGRPRGIAQLEIEYADGTRQTVATDETWKTSAGPVLRNNIYLGEVYDARRELPGWDEPDFDDSAWTAAKLATEPIGRLASETQPPIRIIGRLRPVARTEPKPGVFLFDMGHNFAGWVRLRVHGPSGTIVRLRFGELVYPDGTLNVMTSVVGQIKKGKVNRDGEPPGLAYQGDTYILSGRGEETYVPQFTWHGFRYVEVTGYPGTPPLDAIEGLRLSADVQEAGTFTCSNERFNRIQQMVRRTFLSNLFGVQSDCPARERFGYGGDAVVSSDAFMFNFDMAAFYANFVQDFADAARSNGGITETAPYVGVDSYGLGGESGPIGFQVVFPFLQERLYRYYGDRRLIEEQYPAARRQLEFLRGTAKDYIIDKGIGDHETLAPKSIALTSTAFYYQDAALVAQLAEIVGKQDDAREYRALAERIRQAFIAKFFDAKTGRFDIGTQACQAFGLHYGLVPSECRLAAMKVLLDDVQHHQSHLSTGIFGTRYLLDTLSRFGRSDVAYSIVNQNTFPGWGYMLDHGATTLWEHWEFSDNTYSHNHPMFGSVSAWLFEDLGGIRPDDTAVGFNRITIRPNVGGGLTHAQTTYHSIRGPIGCQWRVEASRLQMTVTVPPNVRATLYVPTVDASSVAESGKSIAQTEGVKFLRMEGSAAVYEVSSGNYQFTSTM